MAVCVPSLAEASGTHSTDFLPSDFPLNDAIIIRGARRHNLKNISCEIPHGRLTVISGVSGSGNVRDSTPKIISLLWTAFPQKQES
jgi:ABC-type uncharacterized transport system fused permease/ATPase subunit